MYQICLLVLPGIQIRTRNCEHKTSLSSKELSFSLFKTDIVRASRQAAIELHSKNEDAVPVLR